MNVSLLWWPSSIWPPLVMCLYGHPRDVFKGHTQSCYSCLTALQWFSIAAKKSPNVPPHPLPTVWGSCAGGNWRRGKGLPAGPWLTGGGWVVNGAATKQLRWLIFFSSNCFLLSLKQSLTGRTTATVWGTFLHVPLLHSFYHLWLILHSESLYWCYYWQLQPTAEKDKYGDCPDLVFLPPHFSKELEWSINQF